MSDEIAKNTAPNASAVDLLKFIFQNSDIFIYVENSVLFHVFSNCGDIVMMIHVNNIDIWYKVSGQGYPIVLLHGNGQDHHFFRKLKRKLSESYTVYAPDSRDHGKSGRVKYLDYMSNMNDIAEFIKVLDIKSPILYGFSDGGIVGLLLAIHHPHLLRKLIISGANTNPDGLRRVPFAFIKLAYLLTSSIKFQMMLTQPNITDEELNSIVTPTLVLAGLRDVIRTEHTLEIAKNIPGCELKLLRGEGHESYISKTDKIYSLIVSFIEKGGHCAPQDCGGKRYFEGMGY